MGCRLTPPSTVATELLKCDYSESKCAGSMKLGLDFEDLVLKNVKHLINKFLKLCFMLKWYFVYIGLSKTYYEY